MGKYIETGSAANKVAWIEENLVGTVVEESIAADFAENSPESAVICVFHNPGFDAAMLVEGPEQWDRIMRAKANDPRRRTYLVCSDRQAVLQLFGQHQKV